MKTKSYNVYTFTELSPEARAKAIEEHTQFLCEQFDSEPTIDDAKQCFAFAGIEISEVYWSGFSSQGDGACFEGKWRASDVNAVGMRGHASEDAELHRIADGMAVIAKAFPFASFSVVHRGHYYHQYCTEFTVSICNQDGDEISSSEAVAAEKDLIELARDAMKWIYCQLEKDYEWQTDEPHVIESIEANNYEYTADGKID